MYYISYKSQKGKNTCSIPAPLMAGFIPSLRFAKREGFSPYRLIKDAKARRSVKGRRVFASGETDTAGKN